jgi:hypothetical protein
MTRPTPHPDDVRWRLDSLFGSLDGDDYRAARADLDARVAALEEGLDRDGIGAGPPLPGDAPAARLGDLLDELNELYRRLSNVSVFLTGHTAVDAFDDAAQAESSTLRRLTSRLGRSTRACRPGSGASTSTASSRPTRGRRRTRTTCAASRSGRGT